MPPPDGLIAPPSDGPTDDRLMERALVERHLVRILETTSDIVVLDHTMYALQVCGGACV